MIWLLEQPLAVVILGVVLGLAVGLAWTSTGRKEWLFGLAAIVVFTIVGLIVEQLVVTDREAGDGSSDLDDPAREHGALNRLSGSKHP